MMKLWVSTLVAVVTIVSGMFFGVPAVSAEVGCDGVPDSGLVVDDCGVCGGENRDIGCDYVCFSNLEWDDCGVCDGNNACLGCDGVPDRGLVVDD